MIYIHLAALLFLFIVVVISDHEGLSWMRGKKETLPLKRLMRLHTLVWVGLGIMIVSGAVMAWPLKSYLVVNSAFWIKMFFVFVLIVNSFFIGKLAHVAAEKSFASLSQKEKLPLLISGAVSGVSWVGAFVAALFMSSSNWLLYFFSLIF